MLSLKAENLFFLFFLFIFIFYFQLQGTYLQYLLTNCMILTLLTELYLLTKNTYLQCEILTLLT